MRLNFESPKNEVARYRIDHQLLQNLLRTFFGALIVVDYWQFMALVKGTNYSEAAWRWPVAWLSHLAFEEQSQIVLLLFLATISFHIACMLQPAQTWKKAVAFGLFFIMIAASSSFGKMDHHLYGFMFASFAFIFTKPFATRPLDVLRTRFYFWAAQTMVLGTYTLAGLWKVRKLFQQGVDGDWANLNPILLQITRISIQSYKLNPDLGRWVHLEPLTMSMWILLVVLESFAVCAAWFPKQQRVVAVAIILFHAATSYLFDIYYLQAAVLAVILFCGHPYVKKESPPSLA